jgi:hypothetical protein
MVTGIAPIKQALVARMRASTPLKAAATGGIHEGVAPQDTAYPFITYGIGYSPWLYTWDSVIIEVPLVVSVFHTNSVEANNLDALVLAALQEAPLAVGGQSTLICRRVGDLSSQDVDEEGKKIYQVGGRYELWTDQPR